MKREPIIMPELGVAIARLSLWFVEEGELVEAGERLLEIRTSAATFDVVSASSGRLIGRMVFPGDLLAPGQALGYIEQDVTADRMGSSE